MFAKLETEKKTGILNPYVNFQSKESQQLHTILIRECIQMRGVECYYIRRDVVKLDRIFGEDVNSRFENAYRFATYINNYESYEAQNEFFSKFGVQANDELTIVIEPELFKEQADDALPREGDLFFFKTDNALFEITYVDKNKPFLQYGNNAVLTISAQKFIYSGEKISDVSFSGDDVELNDFLNGIRDLDGLSDISKNPYSEHDQLEMEAEDITELNDLSVDCVTIDFDAELDSDHDSFNELELDDINIDLNDESSDTLTI